MVTRRRTWLLVGLTLLLVLGLSGLAQAQVIISINPGHVNIPPGGIVIVKVRISGVGAVLPNPACEVQLGTTLASPGITYDVGPGLMIDDPVTLPLDGVIDIDDPAKGWEPFAPAPDNSGGNLVLVALHVGTGVFADSDVAGIVVRADLDQEAPLPVARTIDLTSNVANIFIRSCFGDVFSPTAANVQNGIINVVRYGDLNNNGIVDGADALKVLRCTVGLTPFLATEFQIADVAPPRALNVQTPSLRLREPFKDGLCTSTIANPDKLPGFPAAEQAVGIKDAHAIALAAITGTSLPLAGWPVVVPMTAKQFTNSAAVEHKIVLISAKRIPKPGLAGVQGTLKFDPTQMQINGISGLNGFIVLAHHIDNDEGVVKFVAGSTQKEGLYNGAILQLDVTTHGTKNPSMKLSMQSFDVNGNHIKGKPAFSLKVIKSGMGALKVHKIHLLANPVRSADEAHFTVMGQGIESVRLEIYALSGSKLFDSGFNVGNGVAWPLHTYNRPVANGVYLYVITVRGREGEIFRSEVRKIIILR